MIADEGCPVLAGIIDPSINGRKDSSWLGTLVSYYVSTCTPFVSVSRVRGWVVLVALCDSGTW
jgi:hypothetical protein